MGIIVVVKDSIYERDLPRDWSSQISEGFANLAQLPESYSDSIKKDLAVEKYNENLDTIIANSIRRQNSNVLDVGIGDAVRLLEIYKKVKTRKNGYKINLFGTEIIDSMTRQAQANAAEKSETIQIINCDMKESLPVEWKGIMNNIIYISGDFGYIMDITNGHNIRLNALNSAYDTLKPKGVLFLELLTQVGKEHQQEGQVLVYDRFNKNDNQQDLIGHFYLNQFGFYEMKQLVEASKFDIQNAGVEYWIRKEANGSEDLSRIGKIANANYPRFEGFEKNPIYNLVDPGVNTRMLLTLTKPGP